MATKEERIAALELEIAELTLAISHIRKGGQKYEITSAAGAGTKRVVEFADYKTLIDERKQLQSELAALNGTRGVVVTPGW